MQPLRSPHAFREGWVVVMSTALGVCLGMGWPACAAVESGVYQTIPGATVEESGDRVPNEYRAMPITATLTFDLSAAQPSLTAQIANALLEGDDPFPLTVRSSYGVQLADGSYTFMGDYLREINPSGTQYGFDWNFSTSTNGRVLWNGIIGWMGGHIWYVSVSNLTLVPLPRLSIERVGTASVQITWATNFADHVLEYTTSLPAVSWSAVTNSIATNGSCFSITVTTDESQRFYRLRKL